MHADSEPADRGAGHHAGGDPHLLGNAGDEARRHPGQGTDSHPSPGRRGTGCERLECQGQRLTRRQGHFCRKLRAQGAVLVLDEFTEHGVAGPAALADPGDAEPPPGAEGGRLHHPLGLAAEGVDPGPGPRAQWAFRHAIAGGAPVAEDQIPVSVPLEDVRTLRSTRDTGHDHRRFLLPRPQVQRREVGQAVTPPMQGRFFERRRDEHVERSRGRITKHRRVAKRPHHIGRFGTREGVRFEFLECDSVPARGVT